MAIPQILFFLWTATLGETQDTPGFQFLGYGYDILRANPRDTQGYGDPGFKTNIFKFTNNEKQKTPDGKWNIPDKTTSQPMSTCSLAQAQTIFDSSYSYKRAVEIGVDFAGDFFDVEFDFSIDTKHIRQAADEKKSIFGHISSLCSAYKLTMHTYDHPAVDPNFLDGVASLPSQYNTETEDAYMTFLRMFGTHVVYSMILGGRWGWQMEFKMEDFQMLIDDSIDVGFYLGYVGQVKAGLKMNISTDTKLATKVTNAIYRNSSFNVGGDFKTDVNDWQQSVRNNPMPIRLSLLPVADLLTESYLSGVPDLATKKTHLETAIGKYCPYLNTTKEGYIGSCVLPQPIPMPTPPPDLNDTIHRVCVRNSGGYAMNFDMYIPDTAHSATSDTYPAGQDRCLDGQMIGAEPQEFLRCRVHIIAGTSPDCDGNGYKFNPMSTLQANYECTGTTTINDCGFRGLSQIGEWTNTLTNQPRSSGAGSLRDVAYSLHSEGISAESFSPSIQKGIASHIREFSKVFV